MWINPTNFAYLQDKTNSTAKTGWFNGDFNYDGIINGSDYTLIDNAFNPQSTRFSDTIANLTAVVTSRIATAVPEPFAIGLLGITAVSLLRRRRWY